MGHRHYAKLCGDLTYACQRFAEGGDAIGVVIVLFRGMAIEAEVAMAFAPEIKINPQEFRELVKEILRGLYTTSISKADKTCVMLAEATNSECVILYAINRDGIFRVNVSQPKSNEFVAAFALQVANGLDARN